MALGGGTFTAQNKVLPGSYINFVSAATTALMGTRGIASLPLPLNWGKEGEIIPISGADFEQNSMSILGYAPTASEVLLVREALKRAEILKLYRVDNGGTKASATFGEATATAIYGGTRGNDIKIVCQVNIDDDTKFDISTYLGTSLMDEQTVANGGEFATNKFVSFSSGSLTANAGKNLAGGTNGTVSGEQYSKYLAAIEVEAFNATGYPGEDEDIKTLFAMFVKRLRDSEGKKIVGIIPDYNGDYEGIINVINGVVLTNGTVIAKEQAVAWVTGATAGAQVNESLTNTTYEDSVDADTKYTNTEYETMLKEGKFIFYADNGVARVVDDINSFVSYTPTKSQDFSSNRIMRVLDGWANDVAATFNKSYLGKVNNNENGRMLFKADLVNLAEQYQDIEAIENFDEDDIAIAEGMTKQSVQVDNVLDPVDSMGKLYMTVLVQ